MQAAEMQAAGLPGHLKLQRAARRLATLAREAR